MHPVLSFSISFRDLSEVHFPLQLPPAIGFFHLSGAFADWAELAKSIAKTRVLFSEQNRLALGPSPSAADAALNNTLFPCFLEIGSSRLQCLDGSIVDLYWDLGVRIISISGCGKNLHETMEAIKCNSKLMVSIPFKDPNLDAVLAHSMNNVLIVDIGQDNGELDEESLFAVSKKGVIRVSDPRLAEELNANHAGGPVWYCPPVSASDSTGAVSVDAASALAVEIQRQLLMKV